MEGLKCRVCVLAAAAAALSLASPAQLPSPEAVFQEAKTAAAALPDPLAAKQLKQIALYELPVEQAQGLQDLDHLAKRVRSWPGGEQGSFTAKAAHSINIEVQSADVTAYIKAGDFKGAMARFSQFKPGADPYQAPVICSNLISSATDHSRYSIAVKALHTCIQRGFGFPYWGADRLIGASKLGESQRRAVAMQGIRAAGVESDYVQLSHVARFLKAAIKAFPRMEPQIEDAAIAVIQSADAAAARSSGSAHGERASGAQMLVFLDGLDPVRAQQLRAKYPALSTARSTSGLVLHGGADGKVHGVTQGPGTAKTLADLAQSDGDRALTMAGKIKGEDARFRALTAVAMALAKKDPARARSAAAQAESMLDDDLQAAETASVVHLAKAYFQLGDQEHAQSVAASALAALNKHVEQLAAQFDISTGEGAARAAISYYTTVATILPHQALDSARSSTPLLKPLALASVARGLATRQGKKP